MSMLRKIILPLSICCALALLNHGCATRPLTKEECKTSSMYERGLADGSAKRRLEHFAKYQQQCSQFNVALDESSYYKGWTTGNQSYCQPKTAFSLGKAGAPYPMVCTTTDTKILKTEYQRGFQIHQRIKLVKQQLLDIEKQEKQGAYINAELRTVAERRAEIQSELANGNGDPKAQQQEIDELNAHMESLQIQLTAITTVKLLRDNKLEEQKAALYRQLSQLKATT